VDRFVLRPGIGAVCARVNAGFVAGTDGVLVVDTTNYPADGQEIAAFVCTQTAAPVKAVVNTHNHADHTFGNQAFQAQVVAHRLCRKLMEENLAGSWSPASVEAMRRAPGGERLAGLAIRLPDVTFDREITFHLGKAPDGGGERVAVVEHTGGHTPGHAIVRIPDASAVFGGDLFFVGRYPFVRQANASDWIAALRRIKQLRPEVLIPGHGPVCDGPRAVEEADRHIRYFEETKGMLADMVARGLSREEIMAAAAGFPRFPGDGYERLHAPNLERLYAEVLSEKAGR
jgi:cyclase